MFLSQIVRRQQEYARAVQESESTKPAPVDAKPPKLKLIKKAPKLRAEPVIAPIIEVEIKADNPPDLAPLIDLGTEPVNDLFVAPVIEPVIEPIAEPVIEPIAEPVIEPIAEPVIEAEIDALIDAFIEPEPVPAPVPEETIELVTSLLVEHAPQHVDQAWVAAAAEEFIASIETVAVEVKKKSKPTKASNFDYAAFHKRYVVAKPDEGKVIGVLTPLHLHAKLTAYLKRHKNDPNAPKSLKEAVLMCINHTMSTLK